MIHVRSLVIGVFCALLLGNAQIAASFLKNSAPKFKSVKSETGASEKITNKTIRRKAPEAKKFNKEQLAEMDLHAHRIKQQKIKNARAKIAEQIKAAAPAQIASNNLKIMTDPSIVPYVKELHTDYSAVPKDILLSATMQIIDIKNAEALQVASAKTAEISQAVIFENAKNPTAESPALVFRVGTALNNWFQGTPPKVSEPLPPTKVSPQDIKNSAKMDWQIVANPVDVPLANVYKSLQVVNEIYSKNIVLMTKEQAPYVKALQAKYPNVNKQILVEYVRKWNPQYGKKEVIFKDKNEISRNKEVSDQNNLVSLKLAEIIKSLDADLPTKMLNGKEVLTELSQLQELSMTIHTLEVMNKKYVKDSQFPVQKRAVTLILDKDIILAKAQKNAELTFQATVNNIWKNSDPVEFAMAQLEKIAADNMQKDIVELIVGLKKQYALDLLNPNIQSQAVAKLVRDLEINNLKISNPVMKQSIDNYVKIINKLGDRVIVLQDCMTALVNKSKNYTEASSKLSLQDSIDWIKDQELMVARLNNYSKNFQNDIKNIIDAVQQKIGLKETDRVDLHSIIRTKEDFLVFSEKLIKALKAEMPITKIGDKMRRGAQQVYELQVGGVGTMGVALLETPAAGRLALINSIESTFQMLNFSQKNLSPTFTGFIDGILAASALTLISLLGAGYLSKDEKKKAQGQLYQAVVDDVISVIAAATGASEQAIATGNVTNIGQSAALNKFVSYINPTDPTYDSMASHDPQAYTKNIDRFRESLIQKELEAMRNKQSKPISKPHATKSSKAAESLNMAAG